ncbi:hypothetical protein [Pseudoalteromonas luteoviolacea]|uniref:ABC transmembrane type-1 domain-containing protein n=1 Tax=Pseudoalteromonas luteoviolacea DSM 6061 TaxID=1365250 RepID=A0A167AAF4_9GAMM|nr:hypothetical protein [Pseudoalteromonas luteoviolacea]KZN45155.1 hypothetical protein N475_07825 [Pseudoalteromonas luteoviolacea DSM 6061]KZN60535.1 hypothetical protein N474_05680 [Pseudoalteromonas luteoviolacea CPMOR-2]TQF71564.1 hypothetical protein FLM44_10945 [Pseudoalteromonas luteoviolacea]
MWPKTILGFLFGLLISVSVALNTNLILPFAEDTRLLIGLILGFPIWASIMVWAYAFDTARKAAKYMLLVLLPSALLNVFLMV